ncbi:MAG: prepilin peptidase [Alphaproteobacteria bacterium]|nr:prepilin peptidase [Alphaproteobacteria bacterium]
MLYILIGFILGFIIPYLARRFAKIMQETPTLAYALYRIITPTKHVTKQKYQKNHTYRTLKNKYIMRSLGWGIITASILFLLSIALPQNELPWISFFVIILLMLTEIDKKIQFLPDILTSPLLIGGFTYATFSGMLLGNTPIEATQNSALGAIFGYLIPVIASLLMIKKHPDNLGGGDIKLLAAIGAWLGLANIPFIILLACIIFGISYFITKKRTAAFGPSIVLATLLILFLLIY